MKKKLITAALPYVNNIPHLGNLVQVLSADIYARYCRSAGYETMYICGTDEYGTATETKAKSEKITPKELCDRFHKVHHEIYQWFDIKFDKFGRTSDPIQTEIVQDIFKRIHENGFIVEDTIEQLYCKDCDMFLADRYVKGTCPYCKHPDARGDQCEICGEMLDPTDLIDPKCITCNHSPDMKKTNHLYIDLPKISNELEAWVKTAADEGKWSLNSIRMTESWIRDGLKKRAITRDLKWGIPVPLENYEKKVFYVWFDAPIGYISITAGHIDNWKDWWMSPETTELIQFLGKDNIPFHTVIFPSSLIATRQNWTKLNKISSTEYLNYELGKFSKSKGVGIFGDEIQKIGLGSDVWRFYVGYNRPEKSDTMFSWDDFQDKLQSELIGNFGNLINRTMVFSLKYYTDKKVIKSQKDNILWSKVDNLYKKAIEVFENIELKQALKYILEVSDIANKQFQESEPWKYKDIDKQKVNDLLYNLLYIVKDLGILIEPFMPQTSNKIFNMLGLKPLKIKDLGSFDFEITLNNPEILFSKFEDEDKIKWRNYFSGNQESRTMETVAENKEVNVKEIFREKVFLQVAQIVGIENHPEAEKLYIIKLDVKEEEERQIVSGLVGHYTKEDLLNKKIIIVSNLKAANFRGVKSRGMLLAASAEVNGAEIVDVIFVENAEVGQRIMLNGDKDISIPDSQVKIDKFFEIPILTKNGTVMIEDTPLVLENTESIITTKKVMNGRVG